MYFACRSQNVYLPKDFFPIIVTCAGGAHPPPPEMTCGFLIQLVFCPPPQKKMWFIGVEVEQETSAPPPKKNPGSAPDAPLLTRGSLANGSYRNMTSLESSEESCFFPDFCKFSCKGSKFQVRLYYVLRTLYRVAM